MSETTAGSARHNDGWYEPCTEGKGPLSKAARHPVEKYVNHARHFGDPRSVYETATEELTARQLGYLAARLRRLRVDAPSGSKDKWDEQASWYWSSSGPNRKRVCWPKFRLTERERLTLARRLLGDDGDDVDVKTIANYTGASKKWIKALQGDLATETECAELYERHGPVDLCDAALDTVDRARYLAALGHSPSPSSARKRATQSISPGDVFGRLTVLSIGGRDDHGHLIINVRCSCGVVTTATASQLRNGRKRSCGCLAVEARFSTRFSTGGPES